jgi:uncharacterized protein YdeI (YjbR/CyaY-like superfamily)
LEKLPEIYLSNRADWRDWLAENHAISPGVWLIYYKKHTGVDRVAYEDAVEEALCFGWIDSTAKRMDNQRYCQWFAPRRRNSGWSGLNRRRAEALMASGAMTAAGLEKIAEARANGNWDKALEDRVDRPVPPELAAALDGEPRAEARFHRLTPTQRKYLVNHVAEAKKEETRLRRAAKVVEMILAGKKPGM